MAYRNKTYVIFDADSDINYYRLMQAWKENQHIDFNFHDAHDLNNLRDGSSEETIKRKLRDRMNNAKQAVVLVGESTKNLYKFVRWEIDQALELGIPIVVVNLNQRRTMDADRCPPILKGKPVVHVSFQPAIIKYALDDYADNYAAVISSGKTDCYYQAQVYSNLRL